jgi:hypothetical protein
VVGDKYARYYRCRTSFCMSGPNACGAIVLAAIGVNSCAQENLVEDDRQGTGHMSSTLLSDHVFNAVKCGGRTRTHSLLPKIAIQLYPDPASNRLHNHGPLLHLQRR